MNKFKIFLGVALMLFMFLAVTAEEIQADQNLHLGERILRNGSQGADVAVLQRLLQDVGVYEGRIDGLFGPNTEEALRRFQKDNDLKVNGEVNEETLNQLPDSENISSKINVSRDDIMLLARIIYAEARGEIAKGKVAIGSVIINRVEDERFPNNVRDVILEQGQFSSLLDGQANLYPDQDAIDAAKAALLGYDPTHQSIFFYNPSTATNLAWISNRPIVKNIGGHVFAR
ncbi:MAG: cell wall hydrolase [Bacillota bacterium]